MDSFRRIDGGGSVQAWPGTNRHRLYSRSNRFELVASSESETPPESQGHLENLSKAQLLEIAGALGLDVPKRATNTQIITLIREGRD
jgi:hypothetical protein